MGRPQKYSSDEERKAADAERKRKAREQLVDPTLPERDLDAEEPAPAAEMVEFEGKLYPRKHNCSWTLEQYLAHELVVTKSQIDNLTLRDIEVRGENTMQRSERYLRWRYAGFIAGQISSL